MITATEPDSTARKVDVMNEWAEVLAKSAHDALERIDSTLTLAEAKVAMVREMVARRRLAEAVE